MSRVHERRRIHAEADGRLDERGREKLERHLAQCETCRRYRETVVEARRILADMGEERPRVDWPAVTRGLDARIERREARDAALVWSRRALVASAAALAASILLVVVLPLLGTLTPAPPPGGAAQEPVTVERTLEDMLEREGMVTLVGSDTRWQKPGLGWKPVDLHTVVTERTVIATGESGAASVQIAPSSGVHIDASSSVRFSEMRRGSVMLELEQGSVSLDLRPDCGLEDLRVLTPEARVQVTGTRLRIDETGGRTRVVVVSGRVRIAPRQGGDERIVVAPALVDIDTSGFSTDGDDTKVALEEAIEAVDAQLFNFFDAGPGTGAVTFVPRAPAGAVTVLLDGKKAGEAPLTMLVAPGLEQATLEFPDGSSLETPFDVLDAETTLVAFMPPDVQTLPARNEHRPRPAEAVEKAVVAQGEEEAPGDVHEGWLAPQIVKMVMKKHNGRLRDCYQKYLGGNPETAVVKARIRFTVGLSGKVVDSGATTNVDDGTLEACLAGAVTSITFPAPEGGTIEFEYPISFSPK